MALPVDIFCPNELLSATREAQLRRPFHYRPHRLPSYQSPESGRTHLDNLPPESLCVVLKHLFKGEMMLCQQARGEVDIFRHSLSWQALLSWRRFYDTGLPIYYKSTYLILVITSQRKIKIPPIIAPKIRNIHYLASKQTMSDETLSEKALSTFPNMKNIRFTQYQLNAVISSVLVRLSQGDWANVLENDSNYGKLVPRLLERFPDLTISFGVRNRQINGMSNERAVVVVTAKEQVIMRAYYDIFSRERASCLDDLIKSTEF